MSNLFDRIDTAKAGSISKTQFLQAFKAMNPPNNFKAAGAEAVWVKLDPQGTGSVAKSDFVTGMVGMMTSLKAQQAYVRPVPKNSVVNGPNSLLATLLARKAAQAPAAAAAQAVAKNAEEARPPRSLIDIRV